ncbi:MAG: hypothetical protein IH840_05355 [Candidatus Heimdallarchaeota archaeon]|nr:hypothetical protein [Candidatus Heimdallarchaeota archaeon]
MARDALTAVVVWLDEHLDSGADSEGVHIRYFLESRASASQASFLLSVEHQIEENA